MIRLVLTCDVCQLDFPERFPADMATHKIRRETSGDWHTRDGPDTLRDKRDLCPECRRIAAAKIGETREMNRRET